VLPLLLALAETQYAGSPACAACHPAIYASYIRTAMGRSLSRAGRPEQLALVPAPVAVGRFKVFRRGDSLYQSEIEQDPIGNATGETAYKLEYVIGSGANGFAYIALRNQRLMEAPLSYYAKAAKWDFSPGYQHVERGFERPITAGCSACHSGFAQPVPNRLGLYRDPPFLEMAIGCENCNGPGQPHASAPGKKPIVNPAKLSAAETERICMKCHQDPEAAPDSDLLAHHAAMHSSRCYRASAGRLTCTTCHDPHAPVAQAAAAAYYRGKCLACHTEASCPASPRGADCRPCHMPKRQVRDIPHAALTNHRIPARP
jgi:hypothetical protein